MANVELLQIKMNGAVKFHDAALQLKEAGRKDLKNKLSKNIREAGKPAVEDVRRAVLATPSKGIKPSRSARGFRGGTGLRAAIAKAARVQTSTSSANPRISIAIASRTMPFGMKSLPKYYEGLKVWRHPVFGNTEVWVTQQPHPYFYGTLGRHAQSFRDACLKAIDETLEELSRG